MFNILNGREHFFQWDSNQKLVVEDDSILEVHFCNGTSNCSLVCRVYDEDGLRVVDVPNSLLQDNMRIKVYGYTDTYTKIEKCFEVSKRSKPDDYVYTETELKRYEALEDRVEALENEIDIDEVVEYTSTTINVYKPVPHTEWKDSMMFYDNKADDYAYCVIPVEAGKTYSTIYAIEQPIALVNKDDKEGAHLDVIYDSGCDSSFENYFDVYSLTIPEGYNYLVLGIVKVNWGGYQDTIEGIVEDFNNRFMMIEGTFSIDEEYGMIIVPDYVPYIEGIKIKDDVIVPGTGAELTPEDMESIKADVIAAVEPEVNEIATDAAQAEIDYAIDEVSYTIPNAAETVNNTLKFKHQLDNGMKAELFSVELPEQTRVKYTSQLENDSGFITEAAIPGIAEQAAALIDTNLLSAIGSGVLE